MPVNACLERVGDVVAGGARVGSAGSRHASHKSEAQRYCALKQRRRGGKNAIPNLIRFSYPPVTDVPEE